MADDRSDAAHLQETLDALGHNQRISRRVGRDLDTQQDLGRRSLSRTDALLAEIAHLVPPEALQAKRQIVQPEVSIQPKSFDEIVADARAEQDQPTRFSDLLTPEEIREVVVRYQAFEQAFARERRPDKLDLMAAGVAGSLAAMVDLILVGQGTAALGKQLFSWMGCPTDHVKDSAKVSFDKTLEKVYGATGNHRWNSISHHASPAGFIHAIRDVMKGTSTHVVEGQVVVVENLTRGARETMNKTALGDPSAGLLRKILAAAGIVIAHWRSDVNTSLGLPGPMMLFAQFMEFGQISWNGQTLSVAEMAHELFKNGMDMRRFIGDSITVVIVELLIRAFFFFRAWYTHGSVREALPALRMSPRLRLTLLSAHTLVAGVNAGKVYVTGNPMGINLPQWMALGRYLLGCSIDALSAEGAREVAHVQAWTARLRELTEDLDGLEQQLARCTVITVDFSEVRLGDDPRDQTQLLMGA